MPKLDPAIPEITDAEEVSIQAGIAADPDNPEISAAEFATARPLSETLPAEVYAALTKRDRPRSGSPKELLTLRLDSNMIDVFKATGPDWQVRMNDALVRAAGEISRG